MDFEICDMSTTFARWMRFLRMCRAKSGPSIISTRAVPVMEPAMTIISSPVEESEPTGIAMLSFVTVY